MNYRLKNAIVLALPVQIILISWISNYPSFIEEYYSRGIYPVIAESMRWLYGWIPFSLGDILYTLLGLLAIRYLFTKWIYIRTKPVAFIRNLLVVFSVAYLTFHLLWGLNYYREPLAKTLGLQASYSVEELLEFTTRLTEEANRQHLVLTGNDSVQVSFSFSRREIFKKVGAEDHPVSDEFPELEYTNPSIKGSLYSLALTYMGYGGYLNPFTLESQVNRKIPMFRFPVVSCHEMAHQLGYAAENEANFIGYLRAVNQNDPHIKYAALSYALGYCLADLRFQDEDKFQEVYGKVNQGIKLDYEELSDFWISYENPLEPVFKEVYNSFLKANNQVEGIRSYNQVVALLVAYHKQSPL
ncbi:DUF3810 domain-containing protein [Muriicola soli]|uniref:DUF3810 domain-containing protein n=1 Tax=Muriicola soli TaxID=2507538 RepID=A0A411EA32_9FLAO|nr:DUF3810 domain-containing protein [Muriicola soli]QBA64585.1 DUF3810 domain-containing protein [Muriicola soli]